MFTLFGITKINREKKNVGLGLTSSNLLAKHMGTGLTLNSIPGYGTKIGFTVWLNKEMTPLKKNDSDIKR